MALPPTPAGFSNWNEYLEAQGAIIAAAQGLTFQEGKASVKLLEVAEPVRQAIGTPSYNQYNIFTTWANRTVAPTIGRPWQLGPPPPPPVDAFITTEAGDVLTTEAGDLLIT
jgi:hypothetical protein